jgi:inosine/guanosine/xanthosine phosphorylase family protein
MTTDHRLSTDKNIAKGVSIGVLLGSGLTGVSDGFPIGKTLPFDKIDGLSSTGVAGHEGELRWSEVAGRPCIFICGRKHYYEGGADEIRLLLGLLHDVGVRTLLLTSAAGSLVKTACPGELVLVEDILDVQFRSARGRRAFPTHLRIPSGVGRPGGDRILALDRSLAKHLSVAASKGRVALGRGTVVTCMGPTYETPSEILAFQRTGASLVTMSGAPEIEMANMLGIRVAMVALVSNWAAGISGVRLRHDDVLDAARAAVPGLRQLIEMFAEVSREEP